MLLRACFAVMSLCFVLAPATPCLAGEPGDEAVGLENLLPDSTVAMLGTRQWSELAADFHASAYGRLFADEAFAPLRKALDASWTELGEQAVEDLGFDPLSLGSMLSGPAAVVLLDLSGAPGYTPGRFPLMGGMLVDVGDDHEEMLALVDELLDAAAESGDVVLLTEDVDGADVTTLLLGAGEEEGDGFIRVGLHGGTLVLAAGEQGLEDGFYQLWDALDGETDGMLADAPSYRASLADWSGEGLVMWADTQRMFASLRAGDADGALFGDPDSEQMLGMLDAVGVSTLGPLYQTLVMDGQGSRGHFSFPWKDDTVMGQVAGAIFKPERANLLNLAAPNVTAVFTGNLRFTALFDQVVELMVEFGGMSMADVAAGLAELDGELGFSLRDDLLVNLDGRIGVLTAEVDRAEAFQMMGPTPIPMNFGLLIGLADGEAMRALVDTAVDGSPMRAALTREDFQGFDVYRLPLGMPGMTLFYTVTDDLMVASLAPSMVHDVLRRKLSDDLPNLGQDEHVVAMLKALPRDATILRLEKGVSTFRGALDNVALVAGLTLQEGQYDASLKPVLEAVMALGDIDTAVLEKYLDRPTVETWSVTAGGASGRVLGP